MIASTNCAMFSARLQCALKAPVRFSALPCLALGVSVQDSRKTASFSSAQFGLRCRTGSFSADPISELSFSVQCALTLCELWSRVPTL